MKCVACNKECFNLREFNVGHDNNVIVLICPICAHKITGKTINLWGNDVRREWFENKGWELYK